MRIQIEELKGKSAFDFCRHLEGTGQVTDESLEVYRGDMLSYTISSIKWGALYQVHENGRIGARLRKYVPMSEKDKQRLAANRAKKWTSNSN